MSPATIHALFSETAARFPDRPFLSVLPSTAQTYEIASGEITYAMMADAVTSQIRTYERAGLSSGDRVGILVENRPVFFAHWFALNALGASLVPINPDLKLTELSYIIEHSEMRVAITLDGRRNDILAAAREVGRDVVVVGPDETLHALGETPRFAEPDANTEAALLYTSGTTGRPKGCVLTNTYFINAGAWYRDQGGLMALRAGTERMLTPLPLFHMNAMATSTMAMLTVGGCLCVLDRFHPKSWWADVAEFDATIVHYLGVMPPILINAPTGTVDRAHHVRFGFGAGVNPQLHDAFEQRFGFPLIEAWAMTETGGGAVIAASQEPRHIGTQCLGRPGPECDVRIVSDDGTDAAPDTPGELLIRRTGTDPRHGFFSAYLKDPVATEEAWAGGWFHTGDIVRQDAEGYLYFVDRKKNVIRRSGENISAVEVESVLMQHPRIAAVAVAPVPDELRGDEVFALVVLKPDADQGDAAGLAADIVRFCLERLAYYKAPGYIAFVDALPLTSTQKIQRGAVKDLVLEKAASLETIDTRPMKKRSG
jgi:acyl-CoA synthetase (AMP-forming)/AMP-acid ligase II